MQELLVSKVSGFCAIVLKQFVVYFAKLFYVFMKIRFVIYNYTVIIFKPIMDIEKSNDFKIIL